MYAALVLDDKSKEMLRAYAPQHFEEAYYHHITIKFPCSQADFDHIVETLQPYAEVQSEFSNNDIGCQAVTVIVLDQDNQRVRYQPNGTRLHVTLSCRQGTKPVRAKDVIGAGENGDPLGLHGDFVLL
jgi:hypothetical protein